MTVRAWWTQANAMRSPQEKNTRLENMTWRIWNLARKKKEVRLSAFDSIIFVFVLFYKVPDVIEQNLGSRNGVWALDCYVSAKC